jgi:uncharacterized membrane protein YbjE (DUF340 family)
MKLSLTLFGSVIIGILTGSFLIQWIEIIPLDNLITIILGLVMFSIGIDIGSKKDIFGKIKVLGVKVIYLPISTAIGSIIGAVFVGLVLGLPVKESSAIGSGFGWYSLSAVIITNLYNAETGAIALLSNVFRELIAILSIPFVAKYLAEYQIISMGGATTMDTTLPVISTVVAKEFIIIAFISGFVLTIMVPFIVPMLLKLSF